MVGHVIVIRKLDDQGEDKDLRLRPVCRRGLGSLHLLHCLKPSPKHSAVEKVTHHHLIPAALLCCADQPETSKKNVCTYILQVGANRVITGSDRTGA